ncbi:MAG TPA: transposase [Anaerolineaceae bacterium]|nr:transposase [Anaerolineaceae bacterium]HPN52259.1 transposase [Anaerolineaceae bacterium]
MTAYRKVQTECVVRVIPLWHLNRQQEAICHFLRKEAGRCWTDMVKFHEACREEKWLTSVDLGKIFKNSYRLYSQTIQALAQKLEANLETARKLMLSNPRIRFPYQPKQFQTVVWKSVSIRVRGSMIQLSNGKKQQPLKLPLPEAYLKANIRRAELTWHRNHYELCLTIDTGRPISTYPTEGLMAGVDLGEVNTAAVVTENGDAVVISGRYMRSINRLHSKRLSAYHYHLSRCLEGSRAQARSYYSNVRTLEKRRFQLQDILHKASRQLVLFCLEHNVKKIVIGDVRHIQINLEWGHVANQRIAQWPHGRFVDYVTYKLQRYGITVEQVPEFFSSRTCSQCGYQRKSAPQRRLFHCPACGAYIHRDANGAANICARGMGIPYGAIHVRSIKYLRPIVRSSAFETSHGCLG